MKNTLTGRVASTAIVLIALTSGVAMAQGAVCTDTVKVLAQLRDGLTLLEDFQDEFKALSGAGFQIDYLNEGDRRSKSQADASTTGNYNVYYVDEANLALFASSGWIAPLMDHYPAEYDFADFDDGRQKTATYDGVVYFAPILGGGDIMVYRKDLLDAAGIAPPTTLEELKAAVEKLHNPDVGIYGIALRGKRGSGDNVWRWMPYFKGMGGEWFVDGKPAFNSQAAIDATTTCLHLFKYSAPGTQTGSWDESTVAFLSGQVAIIIESAPLAGITLDPSKSTVVDSVGTNALEPPRDLDMEFIFMSEALAHEAQASNDAKARTPFTVVVGNPPYASLSANLTPELRRIVDPYRSVAGEKIRERNMLQFEKNIQDDYVKFIRLAEREASRNHGVISLITNHGYIDAPTLRGLRWHLSQSFSAIDVIDLHGNSNKNESLSSGQTDVAPNFYPA